MDAHRHVPGRLPNLEPLDGNTPKDSTGSQGHLPKCTFPNPPQDLDLILPHHMCVSLTEQCLQVYPRNAAMHNV